RLERGLLGQEPPRRDHLHRPLNRRHRWQCVGSWREPRQLPIVFQASEHGSKAMTRSHLLTSLAFATAAAAALVAPPAAAQRASLGERVAALEAQAANNEGNI